MFTEQRRNEILKYIKTKQSATVEQLCGFFYVSEATIRRDLNALSEAGSITRTYGGATIINSSADDVPLMIRINENKEPKEIIANLAIKLIENGDTIFLDSGTTTLAFAKKLGKFDKLTVITNNIAVCWELSKHPNINLYCTGGRLRENTTSFIGTSSTSFIYNHNVDFAFISARGIDENAHVTEANDEECCIKKCAIKISNKVVLLCDNSKINKVYFNKICNFSELDYLITDSSFDKNLEQLITKSGCNLIYS